MAPLDPPVDRDPFAGADADQVAHSHLPDQHLALGAVAYHPGGVGLQVEELLHRLTGAGLDQE